MDDDETSADHSERSLVGQNASDYLIEPSDSRISDDEANVLADLLQKTLSYTPEQRMPAKKIAEHQWFSVDF